MRTSTSEYHEKHRGLADPASRSRGQSQQSDSNLRPRDRSLDRKSTGAGNHEPRKRSTCDAATTKYRDGSKSIRAENYELSRRQESQIADISILETKNRGRCSDSTGIYAEKYEQQPRQERRYGGTSDNAETKHRERDSHVARQDHESKRKFYSESRSHEEPITTNNKKRKIESDIRDARDLEELMRICRQAKIEDVRSETILEAYSQVKELRTSRISGQVGRPAPEEIMSWLQECALAKMGEFSPRHIGALLRGHSALSQPIRSELLQSASTRILCCMHEFGERDVPDMLWLLAKLCQHPRDDHVLSTWRLLCRRACERIPDLDATQVANILRACAAMTEHPGGDVINSLLARVSDVAPSMNARVVSHVLWACAKLCVHPVDELFELLAQRVCASTHLLGVCRNHVMAMSLYDSDVVIM
jgi:hypothetical protein